jgi:hypothetical protein
MLRSPLLPLLSIIIACAGCASMLGIDGDYAPEALQDGTGGMLGIGNTRSSGGRTSIGEGGDTSTGHSGGASNRVDSGAGSMRSSGGAPLVEAGSCDSTSCGSGEKCCPALSPMCLPEATIIGCGAVTCDPCPAPPSDGVAICTASKCAVQCNDGFMLQDDKCVALTTGGGGMTGAGGSMSTGGSAGSGGANCTNANVNSCPPCAFFGIAKCCQNNNTCGCTWAPTVVCY